MARGAADSAASGDAALRTATLVKTRRLRSLERREKSAASALAKNGATAARTSATAQSGRGKSPRIDHSSTLAHARVGCTRAHDLIFTSPTATR